MGDKKVKAPAWGIRYYAHLRATKQRVADIARKLGVTEGAVRHWLNGNRRAYHDEVMSLIHAANADPVQILGIQSPDAEALKAIRGVLDRSQAEAAPPGKPSQPEYRPLLEAGRNVNKSQKRRRS